MYRKTLIAGWSDMDFNSHMSNTAYLGKASDIRMMFFADCGFPVSEFRRLRLGPVVMKDEIDYFREFQLLDELDITMSLAGLTDDGSRMLIRNEFFRNAALAARVTSTAGWFDLESRKLVRPPEELFEALKTLVRSTDFKVLPDSGR
jgi:acyl-CoA thioester hydrolase